jgi:predicted metal-dependent enzyme (double-stranded beta helix superfamily)
MAAQVEAGTATHAPDGECTSPLSLRELVAALSNFSAPPTFAELQSLVGRAEVGEAELRPYLKFRPGTYVRTRVLRNEHAELLVLCWKPGHYTSIHDHNGSYSAIRVLSGRMHETIYDYDPERGLCEGESHSWGPGHVTTADIPDIHRIGNRAGGAGDLVTLHCYSPPFDVIRTYQVGSHDTGTLRPEPPREVAVS